MSNRKGFRGYICARMGLGRSAPQHIQQLVMRDYCRQREMAFLLSATEYCMPGCTMMLEGIMAELDHLEGIVMYSIALMPDDKRKRESLYRAVIDKGCALHMAVEGHVVRNWADAARIEEIYLVKDALDAAEPATLDWLKTWDRNDARA